MIDLETLYLILTKVARKEDFYSYCAAQSAPSQRSGTISYKEVALVYELIIGRRIGSGLNWKAPLDQLNLFLSHCGLPAIGNVVLLKGVPTSSDEALAKVHSAH